MTPQQIARYYNPGTDKWNKIRNNVNKPSWIGKASWVVVQINSKKGTQLVDLGLL